MSMCVNNCNSLGVCIDGICHCVPGRIGDGEGMDPIGCQISVPTIKALWLIVLASAVLITIFCVWRLWRGLRLTVIDWPKLVANTQFRLLVTTAAQCLLFGMYASVRAFGGYFAFNDYGATLLFLLPLTLVWVHALFMADLLYHLLSMLLSAEGGVEFSEGPTWIGRLIWTVMFLVFIPIMGSPALSAPDRVIMVRYFLSVLTLLAALLAFKFVLLCQRAITLLKATMPETTKQPIRKMRFLVANVLCAVIPAISLMCVASFSWFVIYFPYLLPVLTEIMCGGSFSAIACLQFDNSKFSKRQPTSPNQSTRESPETRRPSARPDSRRPGVGQTDSHTSAVADMAPSGGEGTETVTAEEETATTPEGGSPTTEMRRLSGQGSKQSVELLSRVDVV